MKLIKKSMLIVLFSALLSGCSSFNDTYDCPLKNGASCISLRDMDNGIYEAQYHRAELKDSKYVHVSHKGLMPKEFPKRTSSLVAKIWLAPYEDTLGNYHGDGYLYTVVNGEEWVGTPTKPLSKTEKGA